MDIWGELCNKFSEDLFGVVENVEIMQQHSRLLITQGCVTNQAVTWCSFVKALSACMLPCVVHDDWNVHCQIPVYLRAATNYDGSVGTFAII